MCPIVEPAAVDYPLEDIANQHGIAAPRNGDTTVNGPLPDGFSRAGLDAAFSAEETRKSNLLLEAQLLRAQEQSDAAAAKFAQAAAIEEELSRICEARGVFPKAWAHRFSALGCWAQAGNFHAAIVLGDDLLSRSHLPEALRDRIRDYTQALRLRRAQWYAELIPPPVPAEV